MKKLLFLVVLILLTGCHDATADAGDQLQLYYRAEKDFKVVQRIFVISDVNKHIDFSIEGRCHLDDNGRLINVICKIGPDVYKVFKIGLSNNATYLTEPINSVQGYPYYYRVNVTDNDSNNFDQTEMNNEGHQ